jgi:electron transfer flavoprotein-quinone oxidoreductase
MDDDIFDAIIVGGGMAGCTAAYELAKAGKEVLLIERGVFCGAKNMTGGRVYIHSLKKVWPHVEDQAPFERRVSHERISMLTSDSAVALDFTSAQLVNAGRDSYTVLRSTFDRWMAEQAEAAGAQIVCGVRVDDLIVRDGVVWGVVAGEDELEARVTVLADGVNSLLAQKLGYLKRPAPSQVAVGCKEVIELPAKVIEDRFQCAPGEGASCLFVGDATHGRVGGGFLYTNKDSVSLGVVATLSDLVEGPVPVYQMMEDLKNHPAIAPIIAGGKIVEYSGHVVPEGGLAMVPKLCGPGVLVTGDAAMLCINLGYMVRGMDFAVASGQAAGQAAADAIEAGDLSETGLAGYRRRLEDSFVLKDMEAFQKFPAFMEGCTRLFAEYPQALCNMMLGMFVVNGEPVRPLKSAVKEEVGKIGARRIFKDVRGGLNAL